MLQWPQGSQAPLRLPRAGYLEARFLVGTLQAKIIIRVIMVLLAILSVSIGNTGQTKALLCIRQDNSQPVEIRAHPQQREPERGYLWLRKSPFASDLSKFPPRVAQSVKSE